MRLGVEAYAEAFDLLSMACPCEALGIVTSGLIDTPIDQQDVADHWVQLGSCVSAILATVTVH